MHESRFSYERRLRIFRKFLGWKLKHHPDRFNICDEETGEYEFFFRGIKFKSELLEGRMWIRIRDTNHRNVDGEFSEVKNSMLMALLDDCDPSDYILRHPYQPA